MESRLERFSRLITALEQLCAHARLQLRHGDWTGTLDSLSRSWALVEDLGPLADALRGENQLPPLLLARARALLAEHESVRKSIAEQLASLRTELDDTKAASARLRRISPAYGSYRFQHAGDAPRRLESVG
jgi:hypothetical protein